MPPPVNPQFLKEIHRLKNAAYERCLWHTMSCTGKPIKAHAIQNSRALDALAEGGHVVMVKPELKGEEFGIVFKPVGRGIATTFTGLCSDHDADLFRPIDTNEIDPTKAEHRFLVAYRAVFKGLHSALAAPQSVQLVLQKGVEFGHLSKDGPEAVMAAERFVAGMKMALFAQWFHRFYLASDWGQLRHVTLSIPMPSQAVAASGVVIPAEAQSMLNQEVWPLLIFSIFPLSASLYVQFSWLPEADGVMRSATNGIVAASGEHQLYLLSKFILKYTETFALKPSVHASFTKQQVDAIKNYFLANAAGVRAEWDDPKLYLFGPVS